MIAGRSMEISELMTAKSLMDEYELEDIEIA